MHDYLWTFKDPETVQMLSHLRNELDICFYLGTMSKGHLLSQAKIKPAALASIQLYEYILYDFIINKSLVETLDGTTQESFVKIGQAIQQNELSDESKSQKLQSELEVVNTHIASLINHEHYCELYARAKTPDYLSIFRSQETVANLSYIRIQNGISITKGTASKPGLMESLRYPHDLVSSIQLYEYIFYEFLLNQCFHDELSAEEEASAMKVLNSISNNQFELKKDELPKLENDINILNRCISKKINNKKYFKLYSESSVCAPEEAMNFSADHVRLFHEYSQKIMKRGTVEARAS